VVAGSEKVSPRRAEEAILITRSLILAGSMFLLACAGDRSGGTAGEETLDRAGSIVDTTAAEVKTGTYIARGSFSGGEITDGRDVHDIEWSVHDGFERIEIRIHEAKWGDSENAVPADVPCRFNVTREDYPARLLVLAGGTRMFSARPPELPADALVTGFYRIICLDDSGTMLAIDVKADTEFEVFETHDPAVINIDIREAPAGSRGGPATVFSLRSPSWPAGERPGHFQEGLMKAGAENSRIIRDAGGDFCVEEGWYPSRKEAEARRRLLAEEGMILLIEERGAGDRPRHRATEQE
jgi:hypothetical protein